MSEEPAGIGQPTPLDSENTAVTRGPGELGVALSHLKADLEALGQDETMPEAQRDTLRRYYGYECDCVQAEINVLGEAENVRAREKQVHLTSALLTFASSEAGRKQSRANWSRRAAGSVLGAGMARHYQPIGSSEDEEAKALTEAQGQHNQALLALSKAQAQLDNSRSALKKLREDAKKFDRVKASAQNWQKTPRWEALTPAHLHPAIRALRQAFESQASGVERCTSELCFAALHPMKTAPRRDSGPETEACLKFLAQLIGPRAIQSLLNLSSTPAAIFRGYLDVNEAGLKTATRASFREFLDVARAQPTSLGLHPVYWSRMQVASLVLAQKTSVRSWIMHVCDRQEFGNTPFNDEEDIFWGSWRAPAFIVMQPAGNHPYQASLAWNRENSVDSLRFLESLAQRFVTFLLLDLEKMAGIAHIESAKQHGVATPASPAAPGPATPPSFEGGPGFGVAPQGSEPASSSPGAIDAHRRQAAIKKVRNPSEHVVLSTAETALYFGIRPRTVNRWINKGKLRKGGRRGTVTIASINRYEKASAQKRRSKA